MGYLTTFGRNWCIIWFVNCVFPGSLEHGVYFLFYEELKARKFCLNLFSDAYRENSYIPGEGNQWAVNQLSVISQWCDAHAMCHIRAQDVVWAILSGVNVARG